MEGIYFLLSTNSSNHAYFIPYIFSSNIKETTWTFQLGDSPCVYTFIYLSYVCTRFFQSFSGRTSRVTCACLSCSRDVRKFLHTRWISTGHRGRRPDIDSMADNDRDKGKQRGWTSAVKQSGLRICTLGTSSERKAPCPEDCTGRFYAHSGTRQHIVAEEIVGRRITMRERGRKSWNLFWIVPVKCKKRQLQHKVSLVSLA